MPAAAVIPAPLAYIKIVAVKTFEVYSCPTRVLLLMMVVGHWIVATIRLGVRRPGVRVSRVHPASLWRLMPFIGCWRFPQAQLLLP